MEVTAHLSQVRIAPRKVRLIANLIRGLDVTRARTQLRFLVKKSSPPILKLLDSAVANAKHNFKLNPDELVVSRIFVNEGPRYRRGRPRSRGQVNPIRKKTSHITLTLAEKKDMSRKDAGKGKAVQEDASAKNPSRKRLTGMARRVFKKADTEK